MFAVPKGEQRSIPLKGKGLKCGEKGMGKGVGVRKPPVPNPGNAGGGAARPAGGRERLPSLPGAGGNGN